MINKNTDLEKISEIYNKINQLTENIMNIDESNSSYRTNFKSWNILLKDGIRVSYNHISNISRDADRTLISIDNESILGKFVKRNKSQDKSLISKENNYNIKISLFHTFFYMFIYSITLSTNVKFIESMGSDGIDSGIIMGLTPLAAIASTVFCSKWTITSYKKPLIFSLICFILGNFLYAIADYPKSLIILGLGRMLIGFGSGRMVNRRYLIEFIPKNELTKYSLYYIMYGALGLGIGKLF